MDAITAWLNDIIWSTPLVVLCLGAGLYFSLRTLFLQVRGIPDMLKQLTQGESSEDGVSSFQSLMLSLSGRVGMGNIGGVATAIAFGGPGAVFWMWAVAFLGAATSFVECTLGQIYKEQDRDTHEYRGGPAYYIEKAYAHTAFRGVSLVYAIVFAVVTVFAMTFFLPGVQANGVAQAAKGAWGIDPLITGIVLTLVLAFIIIGGVKRIASFAGVAVPFMALAYILTALLVMVINFDQIPAVFGMIFASAFNLHAGFGGMLGVAIMWGVKRGIYSNEAGQGTGPHSAAAAEVSHPAKQGYAQAFAVYVDTLFVCSATAFMILSTDAYTVYRGESIEGEIVHQGSNIAASADVGPAFVQGALDSMFAGVGPSFVAIALALFAFTTMLAYYYMAETNFTYLNRFISNPNARRAIIWAARLLVIGAVLYGSISTSGSAWALGDVGVGLMAWLNVIAVLLLQVPALKAYKDFHRQKKEGLDPVFDPKAVGIVGATFWEQRLEQNAVKAEGRAGSATSSEA